MYYLQTTASLGKPRWYSPLFSLLFFHCFTEEKKQFTININWLLPQFYPFSLSPLCEFSINTTKNTPGSHPPFSHHQNVITSIVILLGFGEVSTEAVNFPRTTCLIFPHFSSLINYYYDYSLKCSHQKKIKNNNKANPQYGWHILIYVAQIKWLRRHNLLLCPKDV